MLIEKAVLRNFRNLNEQTVDTSAKHVILTGDNGQGKTNLLESLYLLCYGSSFRTQNIRECVSYGKDYLYLKNIFTDSQGIQRSTEFSFDGTEKCIKLDGKEIKDRKELIYNIPCIVFSHDDIEFVRGEPENRRRFFDQTMTMYDPVFFDDLRRYKQVLRQRNMALKEQRTSMLDIYDQRLAELAMPVIKARRAVSTSFSAIFPDIYQQVSQTDVAINISYRPSWSEEMTADEAFEQLIRQRETDLKMSTTTTGPHRDRFVITDKNGLFANGASTGQMRLASLVLRSAQAAFYRQKTSTDPVFLIDDVLLELDSAKRARYLQYLGSYNQAFFTFLPKERYFGEMVDLTSSDTMKYNVVKGEFIPYEG